MLIHQIIAFLFNFCKPYWMNLSTIINAVSQILSYLLAKE